MARNVQIAFALVLGICFSAELTGCGKKSDLEQPYVFSERTEAFTALEENKKAEAFAEDLCVPKGELGGTENLTAQAAGVFGLDGGNAVYAENVLERMNPASTTKVMTAIVSLKYGTLSDFVTVDEAAIITESGSSMAGVYPGDVLTLEQLLYGLMIPSGNDAANAIAVHVGGSIDGFVAMMNEEAARLGATGTHFANANGLTDSDHYTTAYDLYLMFHEALSYDKFRDIIGTSAYTAVYKDGSGNEKSTTWGVGNYYMNGKTETPDGLTVFGGKTGTTSAAGYCLIMGERTDDGREYASVIMKAESRDALYSDMTKIIDKIDK